MQKGTLSKCIVCLFVCLFGSLMVSVLTLHKWRLVASRCKVNLLWGDGGSMDVRTGIKSRTDLIPFT